VLSAALKLRLLVTRLTLPIRLLAAARAPGGHINSDTCLSSANGAAQLLPYANMPVKLLAIGKHQAWHLIMK
jgi:hypothetical protein